MMKYGARWLLCRGSIVLLLLILVGCAGRAPDVSYYSLTSISPFQASAHNIVKSDVSVAVGPITIPDYLKRVQIATRVDHNRYKFNEFMRWAGLLEENIVTVVGNNLGVLLGTEAIATYPWLDHFEPDYRVTIKLQQLDARLNGDAVLVARWAISDSTGKEMLVSAKSELSTPLKKSTYSDLVDAESQLLAELSRKLAVQIKLLLEK